MEIARSVDEAPAVMAINRDQARHRKQAAIRSPGFESSAARVAVPHRVGSHFHHSALAESLA